MKFIKTVINIYNRRNKLLFHVNNNYCGEISYVNKNNTTIISNLYVEPFYRNKGRATKILKEVEIEGVNNYIKKLSNNNKILDHTFKLCAWEPTDKPHLVSFYEKRGYEVELNKKTKYYDNKDQIFELVEMSKKINY
jgi:GNAT superfamily N-acetyltransferase